MDTFNKMLSFILGLVVVTVFIVVAARGFSQKGNILSFLNTNKTGVKNLTSPTPSIPSSKSATQTEEVQRVQTAQKTERPKKIPKTGPEFLLPALFSSITLGIYLKKRK